MSTQSPSTGVVTRLDSVDAFVVTDLPAAPSADGIVRCAKKVLVDSTRWLARSRTYSWAILRQQVSGASAAVNAVGDGRGDAVASFVEEIAPTVADGRLTLAAGKGVDASDLAALDNVPDPDAPSLLAGLVACAAALHDLSGATVAVEHDAGLGDRLTSELTARGAEVVASGPDALVTEADVLFAGSSPGVVDHEVAAGLRVRLVVGTGHFGVTPRAQAVARRAGTEVVPDFLATAGPLATRAGLDPATTLAERSTEAAGHTEGVVMGACAAAEAFLSEWADELPFGRPIG